MNDFLVIAFILFSFVLGFRCGVIWIRRKEEVKDLVEYECRNAVGCDDVAIKWICKKGETCD